MLDIFNLHQMLQVVPGTWKHNYGSPTAASAGTALPQPGSSRDTPLYWRQTT